LTFSEAASGAGVVVFGALVFDVFLVGVDVAGLVGAVVLFSGFPLASIKTGAGFVVVLLAAGFVDVDFELLAAGLAGVAGVAGLVAGLVLVPFPVAVLPPLFLYSLALFSAAAASSGESELYFFCISFWRALFFSRFSCFCLSAAMPDDWAKALEQ
jgi:membrane-bound ClpP family serine protease